MKVLVTGSAGQVGCRLVRQLLERNHEVRGALLPEDPCRERLAGLDVELVEGDLTDKAYVKRVVDGVEAVIHTANLVGPHFENNLQVNRSVTEACGKRSDSLDRLIYVSSSAVYPNNAECVASAYHPIDEVHPKWPIDDYGLSKYVGELIVEMIARQTGLRTVIVRPSHVLSGTSVCQQFTVRRVCQILQTGQKYAGSELFMRDGTELWHQVEAAAKNSDQPCSVRDNDGRPWYYQPNDARDVAHCLVCALEQPAAVGEAFNVGAPAPFLFPEAAEMLAEQSGQEPLEIRLPVRWRFDHDITKARSWIGFEPRGDLQAMMASAHLFAVGEHDGYTWEGV
jgi:nucleoside-diphosphate-sugar epimerase